MASARGLPRVASTRIPGTLRATLAVVALWGALGLALSAIAGRIADWYTMTDELLYERLAISVADTLSPLPRLRGEVLPSVAQLYPLLIAPAFRHGTVASDLHQAHLIGAWVMSSACIPAYLLARRVTERRAIAFAIGALSVVVPWILYSSLLLSEVAAYPVSLWALLALQCSVEEPTRRNDLLALLAIALAYLARAQLVVLVAVLPFAVLAQELGRSPRRPREALRRSLRSHPVLAAAFAACVVLAVALSAAGRLSSVLGVYRDTAHGDLMPGGTGSSLLEHTAILALGLGILPFIVGAGWLLAAVVRPPARPAAHAFACLGSLTLLATLLEVTIYDLRLGIGRVVFDRYLFYLVPILLVAVACALLEKRLPRRSLLVPTAAVTAGFAIYTPPPFTWSQFEQVNTNTPVATLYRPLVDVIGGLTATRFALAIATAILGGLFIVGSARLSRPALAALVAAPLLVLPLSTVYVFHRMFDVDGWSFRPVTATDHSAQDWVDRAVGRDGAVSMVPYPVSSDFYVSQQRWEDYEFWNKSVVRDVHTDPHVFWFTGNSFPKISLRFDPATGTVDSSPTQWVLRSVEETRFRIAGNVKVHNGDVMLVDAGPRWRLDWLSRGLYDDGWTRPGTTAQVRVYAAPGQGGPQIRTLSFDVRSPEGIGSRRVELRSNTEKLRFEAGPEKATRALTVCVPARGFAEVSLRARGASEIEGDLRDLASWREPRLGGVFVAEIALADELGGACRPR